MSAVRQAGPVSVECGGRVWRLLQSALISLAVFALSAWAIQRSGAFDPFAVFGSAAVLTTFAAWSSWRLLATAPSRLTWDGQQWVADGEAAVLSLQVDFGAAMLFRVRQQRADDAHVTHDPQGARSRWLMPTRREAGTAWHALRVAAHARQRIAAT